MGYSQEVAKGFGWHAVLRYASIGLVIGKSFVVAKILSPEEFGVFALVTIALGVSEAATETGVNTTILQSNQSVSYFLNSAWVIAIVRGFAIGLLMLVLGFFMSDFFNNPQLLYLIGAISLAPVIKGFINPARVSFHKELRFFHDTSYRFALILCEVVTSVVFTMWLHSVFGLVLSVLVTSLFEVIISFAFIKEWPKFQYIPVRGKVILDQAWGMSLLTLSTYLAENIDDFIIGKMTGAYNLGLYHWGYKLGHLPNADLGKAMSHGTLPVFVKIKGNQPRLRLAFTKSMRVLLLLVILTTIPVYFVGPWSITTLLGEKWSGIIPLLPWLLAAGLIQSIINQMYTFFLALNLQRIINTHQVSSVIVMIPSVAIGAYLFGVVGAAVGLLASRVLVFPYLWLSVQRVLAWNKK